MIMVILLIMKENGGQMSFGKRVKCKCGKVMAKLYQHHNQHHPKGQWEHVGYMCNSCNTINMNHKED